MQKNYILDTNVLLQDPEAIYNFGENNVIIPIGVLEELDRFKKEHGELGRNSREVCRKLDILRIKGDLNKGVILDGRTEGKVMVIYGENFETFYKEHNIDFHVLYIARHLLKNNPYQECIVISRDINVRIRANAFGFKAEDYELLSIKEEIDRGYSEIKCESRIIEEIDKGNKISICEFDNKYYPNHYLLIKEIDNENVSILGKVSHDGKFIGAIDNLRGGLRIKPKNIEQAFILDALFDDKIKLVSLIGKPGSGKTLLAVSAGYYFLSKTDKYDKLLIGRPMVPLGYKDTIGYLPGLLQDKTDPWMKPIYDAFEVICSSKKEPISGKEFVHKNKNIEIEVLNYIRGRSINNQFFILDEAQGTTPLEIKTVITRAGEETKIVLTGDIEQIDNPYLDRFSNGLTVATKAFIGSELSAHIVMSKVIRSKLAEEASNKL